MKRIGNIGRIAVLASLCMGFGASRLLAGPAASPVKDTRCAAPAQFASALHTHPSADGYAALGEWFGEKREFQCAAQAYGAAVKLQPRSGKLHYQAGLALLSSGDDQKAVDELQKSIAIDPTVLQAHLLLATAYDHLGFKREAGEQWAAAAQIDPRSVIALRGLCGALLEVGNNDAVIGLLGEKLHDLLGDEQLIADLGLAYGRAGMLESAATVLEQGMSVHPASLVLASQLTTVYVRQGQFDNAIQLLEKQLALHPESVQTKIDYFHALVIGNQLGKARALGKQLLTEMPDNFDVLYLNGAVERESGQFAIARAHLEQAVKLNPNHYNCQFNLGATLAQLHEPEQARVHLEKALELGAPDASDRYELAMVYRTLGMKDKAQAMIEEYQKLTQEIANRALASGRAQQGEVALAAGNTSLAVSNFREAVAATPNNAWMSYKLAMALDKAGDLAAERDALEKAVAVDPKFALALHQLGYVASQTGDLAAAEKHFREAIAAAPGYTQAWISLAATLGMQSKFAEATEAVNRALEIEPANQEAMDLSGELRKAQRQ